VAPVSDRQNTDYGGSGIRETMAEPLVIEAGEMGAGELLETLRSGQRVIVKTEFLGAEHEVTLRHDGGTYYCDTPTRLHKHESAEKMRECLINQGYSAG
jgi:hemin uptake protein HemP